MNSYHTISRHPEDPLITKTLIPHKKATRKTYPVLPQNHIEPRHRQALSFYNPATKHLSPAGKKQSLPKNGGWLSLVRWGDFFGWAFLWYFLLPKQKKVHSRTTGNTHIKQQEKTPPLLPKKHPQTRHRQALSFYNPATKHLSPAGKKQSLPKNGGWHCLVRRGDFFEWAFLWYFLLPKQKKVHSRTTGNTYAKQQEKTPPLLPQNHIQTRHRQALSFYNPATKHLSPAGKKQSLPKNGGWLSLVRWGDFFGWAFLWYFLLPKQKKVHSRTTGNTYAKHQEKTPPLLPQNHIQTRYRQALSFYNPATKHLSPAGKKQSLPKNGGWLSPVRWGDFFGWAFLWYFLLPKQKKVHSRTTGNTYAKHQEKTPPLLPQNHIQTRHRQALSFYNPATKHLSPAAKKQSLPKNGGWHSPVRWGDFFGWAFLWYFLLPKQKKVHSRTTGNTYAKQQEKHPPLLPKKHPQTRHQLDSVYKSINIK